MPDDPHPADAQGARSDVTVQEPSRAQQALARRVAEARAIVPAVSLQAEVDVGDTLEALGKRDPRPSMRDALVKACGLALRDHPRANARWRDGRFELLPRVIVAFAVPAHGTLFFPTIPDADSKPLEELAAEAGALEARVAEQTITQPELGGATFTVTVLEGADAVEPVIQPPQAGALAAGSVGERALVRDGRLVARPAITLTLACDHRILYGAEAAAFLDGVRALLGDPGSLFA